jgi:hypothetical protein
MVRRLVLPMPRQTLIRRSPRLTSAASQATQKRKLDRSSRCLATELVSRKFQNRSEFHAQQSIAYRRIRLLPTSPFKVGREWGMRSKVSSTAQPL